MVENSQTSTASGKPSITPGQRLEILQQAVFECQKAGMQISFAPLYGASKTSVVMVLANVDLVDDSLVYLE